MNPESGNWYLLGVASDMTKQTALFYIDGDFYDGNRKECMKYDAKNLVIICKLIGDTK